MEGRERGRGGQDCKCYFMDGMKGRNGVSGKVREEDGRWEWTVTVCPGSLSLLWPRIASGGSVRLYLRDLPQHLSGGHALPGQLPVHG